MTRSTADARVRLRLEAEIEAQREVIFAARLVLLAWLGDGVDGGKALRESLPRLREAFDELDDQKGG